jgi:succinoglycan biosynthesis protein ExoA
MSSPGELPFVSIVIPARNEEGNIRACLESLSALDYPADRTEVIIADGNSTDRTREIAESLGAIVVPNEGLTVAYGRQAGFERAKGDFIVFCDADMAFERSWLRNGVKYFDDPTVGSIGGPTLVPPGEKPFGRGAAFVFSLAVAGGGSCQADTVGRVREAKDIPGGNSMHRREVLEQVMPIATPLAASEDVEMNWRIRRNGWRLLHVPDFVVWHYKRPTPARLARQLYRFGVTRCQCGKISREMLSLAHLLVAAWMPLAIGVVIALALLAPTMLLVLAVVVGLTLVAFFATAWVRMRSLAAALSALLALGILLVAWPVGFYQELVFPDRRIRAYLRSRAGSG